MSVQLLFGIGRGCNRPAEDGMLDLFLLHVSEEATVSLIPYLSNFYLE